MIYCATWTDGRKLIIRTPDEESARRRAEQWRSADPEREPTVNATPGHIELVESRGPTDVILAGWSEMDL